MLTIYEESENLWIINKKIRKFDDFIYRKLYFIKTHCITFWIEILHQAAWFRQEQINRKYFLKRSIQKVRRQKVFCVDRHIFSRYKIFSIKNLRNYKRVFLFILSAKNHCRTFLLWGRASDQNRERMFHLENIFYICFKLNYSPSRKIIFKCRSSLFTSLNFSKTGFSNRADSSCWSVSSKE